MSITTTGGELAQIEFRRLSTVAWLSIAVLSAVQALTAQNPIATWQIVYVTGILVFAIASILIQAVAAYESSFIPLMLYLLIAPIVLGSTPEKPWMSYGVLTIFANLYIATIYRRNIAIALMLGVTVFQIWVINLDLSSISDLEDMRLLNTYFSSLWTMGTGVAFMIIRGRYLDASEKIEDEIVRLKERISSRFQSISLQNRDDYRNLKLHGTILNTLIFAKNNPEFVRKRQSFVDSIKNELSELRINRRALQADLHETLEDLLIRRTLKRIRVSRMEVSGRISDPSLENNILEIIREILLNLEKHTSVAEVQIQLHISVDGDIQLRITESAHFEVSAKNLEVRKSEALRSESLKRLLAIIPSQLAITTTTDGFGLVYTVTNLEATDRAGDPREIYRLRNSNLIEFAENIGRATAIFGLLFLPGYFLLGIEQNILILLTFHSAIVAYNVIKRSASKGWLSISTFFSLALPVVISQNFEECANIAYLPWLLNVVMMNALIFATEIRNRYLRWVPIVIISVELFVLPQSYPPGCQSIFLGSTPAIPLVISFALVLGSLRKRLYKQDAEQISSAFVDEANVRKYEDALEHEYKTVISELEDFSKELPTLSESVISVRIENEIQKIRAFLVCSEQFESEIIRELYRFAIGRLRNGVPTRLNILGGFIYQLDQNSPVNNLLTQLAKILDGVPCELSLVKLEQLTLEIMVDEKYQQRIAAEINAAGLNLGNTIVSVGTSSN
jgi:hypothetical protein